MEEIQTIGQQYKLLEDVVEILKHDFIKFNEKKIKIAGIRVKNHLTVINNLTNLMKKGIIQEIKSLPTKHRIVEPVQEIIVVEGVDTKVKTKRIRKANLTIKVKSNNLTSNNLTSNNLTHLGSGQETT